MKKSNKGFTLIELIVVIVLIGIVGGLSALSVTTLSSTSAKSCAAQLNAYIGKCRIACLSRAGDVYIKVYEQDGRIIGEYYEGGKLADAKVLSDGRAKVSFKVGGTTSDLSGETRLKLSFSRPTGGLNPQTQDGKDFCTAIYVTGGGKTYTITIAPSTGNHSIN